MHLAFLSLCSYCISNPQLLGLLCPSCEYPAWMLCFSGLSLSPFPQGMLVSLVSQCPNWSPERLDLNQEMAEHWPSTPKRPLH